MVPHTFRTIRRRAHKLPSETIRLWTIQPIEVWERLRREQTLLVDPDHRECAYQHDTQLRDAYDWMRAQMSDRIPTSTGHLPWWAYDYKPDLRRIRHQIYPSDVPYVRIGLNVLKEDVLLMGYEAWFWVLNRWYLSDAAPDALTEADDLWEEEARKHGVNPSAPGPLPQPWEKEMVASWNGIFDLERWRDDTVIQAVFERLELKDVVEVTEFKSCLRRNGTQDDPR